MSDETTTTTAETSQDAGEPEVLGDAGKKALQEERAGRAAAEKRLREVEAQLESLNSDFASKVAGFEEVIAERDKEITSISHSRDLYQVLLDQGLSVNDAEFVRGSTVEELTESAEKFKARLASKEQVALPKPDMTQGAAGSGTPTSTKDQFAAWAEAALN